MNETPNFPVDSATRPLNVIRCPVCRQECMETDVMENIFVKDSMEAPNSTVERTPQLCMTCDDNTEASGFCTDCVEYLCATCVEAHQRVKFTKDHAIKQKTDISQEGHVVPMFCDIHKQEPLKLFCETCDLLTCRDCQLVKHKDHNYQFLEDAYKNHKQRMESMMHQLQEKKKVIEEVSNSINNGLLQVDENRTSVHNEIKKSICSLISEINKKGKMLVHQLETVTKDHESVLRKQQEDVGYLCRHFDHVISFTKWATGRNGGTALLFCKRLILFQIGNLLRAKCSTSFIPQSSIRFHCRSSYWASTVDLGSLAVENVPGHQLAGSQGIPHQLSSYPGQGPSGSPSGFVLGPPHNTLAQLQMQVDKLNPQVHWHPQPPPPPWTWYQSVRLQKTVPGPRFMLPPPNHVSPTSSLPSSGFTPQPLRGMGSSSSFQPKPVDAFSSPPLFTHVTPQAIDADASSPHSRHTIEPTNLNGRNDVGGPTYMLKPNYPQSLLPSLPHRNVKGQLDSPGYPAVPQEEKPGTVCWKPAETQQDNRTASSAVKKRRRSSPGPIIIIKDEPTDDSSYVQANHRVSLPDSTGDQAKISVQGVSNQVPTPCQSSGGKPQNPSPPPRSPQDQSQTHPPTHSSSLGGEKWPLHHRTSLENPDKVLCAVCRNRGGELLCCNRCPKVFHLTCHVPTLFKSPSGKWFCSLCRGLLVPEMESDCDNKPEAKTVKQEPDSDGGFPPLDKQKCEQLLLHLFCSELSSGFEEAVSLVLADNRQKAPTTLSTVKRRLEAQQSLSYQTPAEFIADIRLLFRNHAELSEALEADAEVSMAARKLKELFEEHLKIIYPDQTFPEIKMELIAKAPLVSQPPTLDNTAQSAKHQRTP
ncbi:hypothetical protein LDENG_00184620 [Lucifuga dentata]|nr:hypothetical protein LDENG_00184620 [Lucifuga dentata]